MKTIEIYLCMFCGEDYGLICLWVMKLCNDNERLVGI